MNANHPRRNNSVMSPHSVIGGLEHIFDSPFGKSKSANKNVVPVLDTPSGCLSSTPMDHENDCNCNLSQLLQKLEHLQAHWTTSKRVRVTNVFPAETPSEVVETFLKFIGEMRGLLELELHVPLRSITPSTIIQMLKPSFETLHYLNLSKCNLSHLTLQHLRASASDILPLKHLDISHNFLNTLACKELSYFLRRCPKLRILRASYCHIDPYGMENLARGMSSLYSLSELDLSHNSLSDCGAESLFDVFSTLCNLQKLDVSSNFWSLFGTDLRKFSHLVNLRTLNMSGNWIRNFGVGLLLTCLTFSGRTLKHLILQDVNMTNHFWEEARMYQLFNLILTADTVVKLNSTHNHFSVQELLEALNERCFPNLQLLDLRYNELLDLNNQQACVRNPR